MRSAFILLSTAVLLLCACATQAQREAQAIRTNAHEIVQNLKTCADTAYNSPEFAPLRAHIPLTLADVTLQQLSDPSFASSEEIRAILINYPELQQCRKNFLTGLSATEPSTVPIFAATFNRNDDDLLRLMQHKMTWGKYVRLVRDRAVETQAAVEEQEAQIFGQLRQEHQAELAQRQRAAEALAAWAQTQQLINAANQPVITNCNLFSNTVNCVSR